MPLIRMMVSMLNRLFRKTLGPEYTPYFKSDLFVREAMFWRFHARKLKQAALINGDGPPGRVVLMNAIFLPGAQNPAAASTRQTGGSAPKRRDDSFHADGPPGAFSI